MPCGQAEKHAGGPTRPHRHSNLPNANPKPTQWPSSHCQQQQAPPQITHWYIPSYNKSIALLAKPGVPEAVAAHAAMSGDVAVDASLQSSPSGDDCEMHVSDPSSNLAKLLHMLELANSNGFPPATILVLETQIDYIQTTLAPTMPSEPATIRESAALATVLAGHLETQTKHESAMEKMLASKLEEPHLLQSSVLALQAKLEEDKLAANQLTLNIKAAIVKAQRGEFTAQIPPDCPTPTPTQGLAKHLELVLPAAISQLQATGCQDQVEPLKQVWVP